MPRGAHLTSAHQTSAAMRPRARKPSAREAEQAMEPGETMDQASLRLQRARADTEELDRAKRQLELDIASGALIPKERAVDVARGAIYRLCALMEQIPERMRDRLPQHLHEACDVIDDIVYELRVEAATITPQLRSEVVDGG